MGIEINDLDEADFRGLIAELPPEPIKDDRSYRDAIAILDRLFALDNRRTPAEMNYFRALARIARDYEIALDPDDAQTRTYRARPQPMLGGPFDERLHRLNKESADLASLALDDRSFQSGAPGGVDLGNRCDRGG